MGGEKFLFDNNMFDDDPLAGMIEEEEISRPEFTKEQLEAEKQKAYDAGQRAGFKESEAGLTKSALTMLQKIERDIAVLFAAENDRAREYEEEAIHLTLKIIQKLFPLYMKEYGEQEIKSAIKTALSNHNTPEKITIELQENLLAPIKGYIKELGGDLNKEITLTANESLNQNECKISWPNGGIICNHTAIAKKTLQIIKETLAERGISVHDEENNNSYTSDETEDKTIGEA